MRVSSIVLAVLVGGSVAGAQAVPRAYVRVTARDSSGAPIGSAELTVTRGLKDVVARGITDETGHGLLSFDAKDSLDIQVTMRKMGYPRSDRFFGVGPRDTANVSLVVATPKASTLEAVQVSAKGENPWTSYHLDADQIANSDAVYDNAWDVVKRLRPVMLESRGGCSTGIQNVWVNGKRIVLPLRPTGMAAARALVGVSPRARFSYVPVTVLSDIAPEHIEEIIYHDCFDHSVAAVGHENAIYVVLKPGVVYLRDQGSYVVDDVTVAKK
jgi:hypothetical protein